MSEEKTFNLFITMKSGRAYRFNISETELDWLIDKLFEREKGMFQNFASDEIINISDIEYLKYEEVKQSG